MRHGSPKPFWSRISRAYSAVKCCTASLAHGFQRRRLRRAMAPLVPPYPAGNGGVSLSPPLTEARQSRPDLTFSRIFSFFSRIFAFCGWKTLSSTALQSLVASLRNNNQISHLGPSVPGFSRFAGGNAIQHQALQSLVGTCPYALRPEAGTPMQSAPSRLS